MVVQTHADDLVGIWNDRVMLNCVEREIGGFIDEARRCAHLTAGNELAQRRCFVSSAKIDDAVLCYEAVRGAAIGAEGTEFHWVSLYREFVADWRVGKSSARAVSSSAVSAEPRM